VLVGIVGPIQPPLSFCPGGIAGPTSSGRLRDGHWQRRSSLCQASAPWMRCSAWCWPEVACGKRRDWKVPVHQSKTTLGGKVNDGRVYVRSGDFADQAAHRPVS
jgi:hypothetical protein